MESFHLFSKYAICYGIFFLLTYISKLNKGHKLIDKTGITRNPGIVFGLQIAGILWLGIVPVSIIHHPFIQIIFGKQSPEMYKILTLSVLIIVSVLLAGKLYVQKFNSIIQQHTLIILSKALIYRYCILRIVFLAAYEIFFRGYLLTDSISGFGMVWAIVLNVFLYTLLHVFSERKEFLVCIPFGILLCAICVWVGAAWPALAMHIVFAITYEFKLAIKFSKPINVII